MALDLIIRNGTLIDGSGAARRRADVGVKDGRIVAVGVCDDAAAKVLDASGLVVAPGFIDPHTHYDAQMSWDPLLDGSSEHGVTTVVMGNCSVGVAPCRPEHRDLLVQELINVEGMSKAVLDAGIRWEWETFPEFLGFARRNASAVNRAFLVPLSPLRTFCLGPDACERSATLQEIPRLAEALRAAMSAGACGFSATYNRSQIGYQGKPLAARLASREELKALSGVLREMRRGVIQIAVTNAFARLADDEYDLLEFLLDQSTRPVTWISLFNRADEPGGVRAVLDKAAPLIRRGAPPQFLLRSMLREFTLRQPYLFSEINVAKRIFNRSVEEQCAAYRDPAFRDEFRRELAQGRRFSGHAPKVRVVRTGRPELRHLEGRSIGEISAQRGTDALDALFDIGLEDGLGTVFSVERANTDKQQIAELLKDPHTLIGLSDGGAHVDLLYEAGYTTWLLGHWVRETGTLGLEQAIHRITREPAELFGLSGRGFLGPGYAADIVVFDEQRIGSSERGSFIYDLPTGAGRLHAHAEGIEWIFVNGTMTWQRGRPTGELPGTVLAPA